MKKVHQISEFIGLLGTVLTMIICGKILKTDLFYAALVELPFAVCLVVSAVLNEKLPEKERDNGSYSP